MLWRLGPGVRRDGEPRRAELWRGRPEGPTRRPVAVLLLAAALVGATDVLTFHATDWGIIVRYPADVIASPTFKDNYFDRGAWRVSYAADTGPGTRVIGLSLPDLKTRDSGGDGKATAELRIGASRDLDVVASCLTYGMNSGNNVQTGIKRIGGVDFTEVPDNSDAEMMKTFTTDDFRAVYKGACIAIDIVLFVGGTSNHLPAYAPAQLDRLRNILSDISFN